MTESPKENYEQIETENQTPASQSSPRRRIRARIAELEQSVADLNAEVEAERDKRLRLAAEYDNYRRRTQGEFHQLTLTAGERIILKLLPVADDFDRLNSHSAAPVEPAALQQGFELIQRKLQTILASEGVLSLESTGKPFDAALHEAVAEVATPDAAGGTVVAEIEKGYFLGPKVIRHAKVVVCRAPEERAEGSDG